MFAAISPSKPLVAAGSPSDRLAAGMHGKAIVRVRRPGPGGCLAHLDQASPLRVLFPLAAEGEPFTAALVTTSGGLVGGDSHQVDLTVGAGAAALVVAGAAEKVYRSRGEDCRVALKLSVAENGWLEFLPQETILFDGARLRRRADIEVASGARLLAGEILVFGRTARGERMTHGLVHDRWQIRRDGRLLWTEALHLDGDIAARLDDPAGFGGCPAAATLVLVADDPAPLLPLVRDLQDLPGVRFAATVVNGVLLARWLATDALALRRSYGAAWATLRHHAAGLPARLPRLWHV